VLALELDAALVVAVTLALDPVVVVAAAPPAPPAPPLPVPPTSPPAPVPAPLLVEDETLSPPQAAANNGSVSNATKQCGEAR
jgi:hypothetical protein